jgi:hypothetical protein
MPGAAQESVGHQAAVVLAFVAINGQIVGFVAAGTGALGGHAIDFIRLELPNAGILDGENLALVHEPGELVAAHAQAGGRFIQRQQFLSHRAFSLVRRGERAMP